MLSSAINPIHEIPQDRFILSGGPGSGKTTLINYLQGIGESVTAEAATDICREEGKTPLEIPNFQEKVVELQIRRQQEASAVKAKRVFFDRAPFDNLAYWDYFEIPISESLRTSVIKQSDSRYYNQTVFLLEDLGFCEQTEVRIESLDTALEIKKRLIKHYQELGFEVLRIPRFSENKEESIKQRAQFVLDMATKRLKTASS